MSGFADRLIRWQKRHGRHDLPWQRTQDPYPVWLSEIMLQQTQVATVVPYYERFLGRFPTVAALAAAPVEQVMELWSGLGYYARARNLHACAREVMATHGGEFPRAPAALAELPGIGRSTANAIAAFCFGARMPILDGNVKRVLCRCLGIEGSPGTAALESRLWRHAEELLPSCDLPAYIQGQMDLGATVCTRARPRCEICPLAGTCIAHRENRVAELPTPRPRKTLPEREATLLVLRHGDRVLFERRPPAGIWGGLLSLPELPQGMEPVAHGAAHLGVCIATVSPAPTFSHVFTHFRLHIRPLVCAAEPLAQAGEPRWQWLDEEQWARAALPAPIRRILGLEAFR
ncbi:A/G-specific adenine glycosylase [Sulfurisoma sediminicola]|uniref:Adenine DNA glycosylase n=1 Tax=Sulfurisoma sediminicola TaxID=1381557 RepID=A0A497XPY7_9PROT|nr:A/G-specific adenine glycosylase [Sulfurisoma sediminicola]RLJ68418.1 A/G-specific DNA-adenine glycosylase [Sulfurisoma sediminicola]